MTASNNWITALKEQWGWGEYSDPDRSPGLPNVRISSPKPNASRPRINKTAKKKLNWSPKSANGMIIPIQYGPGFAGENVFAAGKNGNNLVIGSIIALGEIEEITKVYINDVDASGIAGVTVTEYTGTTAQTADATLAAVFGGYADTLVLSVNGTNVGVAYVVVEIAPGAIDSAPRITVAYKGLKNIEDTRIPNTAYYTNSALCFRNWLKSAVYGPGLSVDDTAFEALADHCDTVPADDWQASHNYAVGNFCKPTGANANNRMYEVTTDAGSSGGTEPASWDDTLGNTTADSGITWTCRDGRRHVCGMPMDTSADLASWIEAWRMTCGAITFYNESGLSGVSDTTRATDHTFTHAGSDFPESPGITWKHESLANTPTVVKVIYTDTSALPWRDGTDARVAKNGVDAGTTPLRESTIYTRGIHRKSEAVRLATKRLNAYALTNLRVSFPLFDEGLEVCAGDVVEITHPVGFSSKTLRVLSNPIQSAGRWLVDGYEYDSAVYSNYLVTEPSSPDFGLNIGASFPRIFISEPTTPYKIGDLWTGGPSGDIKKCKTARTSGAYQAGDWEFASDYDKTLDQLSGKGVNVCNARYSSFEEAALPPISSANGTVTQDSGVSFFGGNSLKMAASAANHFCYLGASTTDYNVKITPNKKWIFSVYNRCSGISEDIDLHIKTSDSGTDYQTNPTSHGTANTRKRVSGIIDLTSDDSTQCIIRLDNDGGNGVNMWWGGIMLEEQYGNLEVPSAYALPSGIISGWDSQADQTSAHIAADAAAYTGASISTTKTDAKCTDAAADQTSTHTAADAAAYTGASIATGNTDAKCTDATADKTSTHTAADAAAYTGTSIAVGNTDAKCTDATADKTSTHESLSAKYLDGSINRSTDGAVEIKKDLKMQNGVDISFYSGGSYKGGVYGQSDGVYITGTPNLNINSAGSVICHANFRPNLNHNKSIGLASYHFASAYIDRFYRDYSTSGRMRFYDKTTGAFIEEYRYAFT